MAVTLITRSMYGVKIAQKASDGYVDATALCKAHFEATGQRKDVSEWLSNQRTQESIKHLSLKAGIPVNSLTVRTRGVGTWIHPRLAIRFSIWLSDDFGYLVEEMVSEWIVTSTRRQDEEKMRCEGKQIRRELTNAIADYLVRHPEISDNHRKWIYTNTSEAVNLVIFGKKAKKLAEDMGVPRDDLRSHFDNHHSRQVAEIENTAIRIIDKLDLDPIEAIKQAGDRLMITNL